MAASKGAIRLERYSTLTSQNNKRGVPIDVVVRGRTAYSEVTIPAHMGGWIGPDQTYAHKGAIATVLETVMAFGGIRFLKRATSAKTLSVEYFTQVPIKTKLRAEATLVERRGDGEAILQGTLRDGKGNLLARSTGTYALYSTDDLRNLGQSKALSELVLAAGAKQLGMAACRPADLAQFEQMLNSF